MAEQRPLEVDNELPTEEELIGDSQSELTSLKSSILEHRYENGRRYNAFRPGSYWGPNDEKAQDHLDIGHHLHNLLTGGRLYLAPISSTVQNVLDIGTGTGIWAIEFADLHPSAKVIGTDLSPIQPTWVPPNVQFEVDDCTDEWVHEKDSFDYIHIRGMYGSIADWDALYKTIYSHLKPGGYIEHWEQSVQVKSDDGTTAGTVYEEWTELAHRAGDAFGKTLRIVDESKGRIAKAGFVDVVEKRFKCPLGPWASDPIMKKMGAFNRLQQEEGLEGYAMYLYTTYLGWTREEVEVLLARMRKALRDPSIHAYQEYSVVWARKPVPGKEAGAG
ncbi:S-adenosyl-L-methionine-dependent methyltransferase [Aspergillus pseudodeflectus]|uniref:S-adenosyl-L-methionine-dependent methyltransferase n=1 Tax=Aspergillus pseudodeflectus TaxID=176178 RepID=A0ABR4LBC9_9EURO